MNTSSFVESGRLHIPVELGHLFQTKWDSDSIGTGTVIPVNWDTFGGGSNSVVLHEFGLRFRGTRVADFVLFGGRRFWPFPASIFRVDSGSSPCLYSRYSPPGLLLTSGGVSYAFFLTKSIESCQTNVFR